MYKILLVAGCILIFATLSIHAQTRTEETRTTTDSTGKSVVEKVVVISKSEDIRPLKNMIIINPLKFFLYYNLSYYRSLSPVVVVGGGFQTPTLKDLSGWGINIETRLHPSAKAPKGFYFAPNLSYNSLTTQQDTYEIDPNTGNTVFGTKDVSVSATSIGGLIGWQWFPGDEFAIGLGLGLDYYILSGTYDNTTTLFSNVTGTVPALRFDIGYAW